MKVLKTNNSIISLENVRRVDKFTTTSKHTSYGKPYTITHHRIEVSYFNDEYVHIECGEDEAGKAQCDAIFNTIYNKLSEG